MTFGMVLNVDKHFIVIKGITLDPLCLPVNIIIISNIFWNGDPSSLAETSLQSQYISAVCYLLESSDKNTRLL